jgi:hypothetical protein
MVISSTAISATSLKSIYVTQGRCVCSFFIVQQVRPKQHHPHGRIRS